LPTWLQVAALDQVYVTLEERMRLAIELSRMNFESGTGGPFAGIVFERDTGRVVAAGVNVVVPESCSLAHGEVMALMFAQDAVGSFDLAAQGLPPMQLVTSAQPCVQCFGAVHWSGIVELVIGARGEDVERITGFDEGPLPPDWVEQLENRQPLPPCRVIRDVLADEACEVLQSYKDSGAPIYNPGSDAIA
jgi:tRNA(Arg) A34 adenosine deaminase TadA